MHEPPPELKNVFRAENSYGEPVNALTVTGREGELTVQELAALVVSKELTAEAEVAAAGMSARPLADLVDMEMVEECDEDDMEELVGSLAESMRNAGARLKLQA